MIIEKGSDTKNQHFLSNKSNFTNAWNLDSESVASYYIRWFILYTSLLLIGVFLHEISLHIKQTLFSLKVGVEDGYDEDMRNKPSSKDFSLDDAEHDIKAKFSVGAKKEQGAVKGNKDGEKKSMRGNWFWRK